MFGELEDSDQSRVIGARAFGAYERLKLKFGRQIFDGLIAIDVRFRVGFRGFEAQLSRIQIPDFQFIRVIDRRNAHEVMVATAPERVDTEPNPTRFELL